MTVASTSSRTGWLAANGVNKSWNFGFKIPASSNVIIDVRNDSTLIITENVTDFSGAGYGLDAGGTITYPVVGAAIATGYSVRIRRVSTRQQTLQLKNQGGWKPEDIEGAFDLVSMRHQEASDRIDQLEGDIQPAIDAAVVATAQAVIATTQAGISTTKAGESAASAAAALGHANTASGHATTATTQAGIATTQAGNAATQAGNALTSANNAAAAASAAAAVAMHGIRYTFSTTTTDADPGNGVLRLGSGTQSSSVVLRADLQDRFGVNVTGILDALGLSNNATKANIRITAEADATRFLEFSMSSVATPSGYRNLTIANIGPTGSPFVNGEAVLLTYRLSGDKGIDGLGAGDVTAAATFGNDNRAIRSDGSTKGVQSSGITIDDSNNVSGVGLLTATQSNIGTINMLDNITFNRIDTDYAYITRVNTVGFKKIGIATTGGGGTDLEDLLIKSQKITTTGVIELGNVSDTTVARLSAGRLGVEGVGLDPHVPQNSQSANYTAVLADANSELFHPSSDNNARIFTIPSNAAVPYPVGTFLFFSNKINTISISIASDTLTWVPSGSTGTRSLAANGMAFAKKVSATEWMIAGQGLT